MRPPGGEKWIAVTDTEPGASGRGLPGRDRVVLLAVLFEGGLAPLALALGWLLDQPPLRSFAWRGGDAAWGAAAALPMLGLFLLAMRWPVGPLARIQRFCDEEIRPILEPCTRLDLALIALAAGIGEEM